MKTPSNQQCHYRNLLFKILQSNYQILNYSFLRIETSAAPQARQYGGYGYYNNPAPVAPAPGSARSADNQIAPLAASDSPTPVIASSLPDSGNTDGLAEVRFHNLQSVCQARAANPFFGLKLGSLFGITVVISTTTTTTSTATAFTTTITSTKTFTVQGCTPSPFLYSTC